MALVTGCSRQPPETLAGLRDEFVYETLAFSPVAATQAGYHFHRGENLDSRLDDYGDGSLERQRRFYRDFRRRLQAAVRPERLDPEDRADYDLIRHQIDLALLELDEIQSWRRNPTLYVELIGNGLFSPYMLNYAPAPERFRHIIARLKEVPRLLEQAQRNLSGAPPVWIEAAIEENAGNISLVDKVLREAAPAELKESYAAAAGPALGAIKAFGQYLRTMAPGSADGWRLGKELYAKKFRYLVGTGRTPDQILADAERDLKAVRKQMWDLALPLHHKWFPSHRDPVDLNLIVGETLAKIAERHSTRQTYFNDARRDLAETTDFVKRKNLVPLEGAANLELIETPEFMRGIYAVGGFVPAPALEPQLGAFYWLTPIPADWPRERVESKLREYNFYSLKLLTIHEAMPGHYVQFEYANRVRPEGRRLLRALFGSGAYIEGWAVYATQMMLDEGYLEGSPELRLTFLKQLLRVLANAILDVRLHTMGMTDGEAMDLMLKQTFQEEEEARAKLRRAKLSSCQLPTYYAGYQEWLRLRVGYQQSRGKDFNLAEFHRRALEPGAVPLEALRLLLGLAAAPR